MENKDNPNWLGAWALIILFGGVFIYPGVVFLYLVLTGEEPWKVAIGAIILIGIGLMITHAIWHDFLRKRR